MVANRDRVEKKCARCGAKYFEPKLLSCVFFDDVLCLFRKTKGFYMMDRCTKCRHYLRFMQEMDEEDERVMDEIDRIRAKWESEFDG